MYLRISFVAILFTAMHSLSSMAFNDGLHMEEKYPPAPVGDEVRAFLIELESELVREAVEFEALRKHTNKQEWFNGGKWQVDADFDHKAHWEWVKQQIYGETERE